MTNRGKRKKGKLIDNPNNSPQPTNSQSSSGSTSEQNTPQKRSSGHSTTFPAALLHSSLEKICQSGTTNIETGIQISKPNVLGCGTANYGHGTIIQSKPAAKVADKLVYPLDDSTQPLTAYSIAGDIVNEEINVQLDEAAASMDLDGMSETVKELEETLKLDPQNSKAHHELGSTLLRLGHIESARRHLTFGGENPDEEESRKLHITDIHIRKCYIARYARDWNRVYDQCEAAIASGADSCIQLKACLAEASLHLQRLNGAIDLLPSIQNFDYSSDSCSKSKFFRMLAEAYPYFVRAKIKMALGRIDDAVIEVEKAMKIDPQNDEVSALAKSVNVVCEARNRGNSLYSSGRLMEAIAAYGEGIDVQPENSVLYNNRAACWFKLENWERCIDDCNPTLILHPNYTKAQLRRAHSFFKLERWEEAVNDYAILHKELPNDKIVAQEYSIAQSELRKSITIREEGLIKIVTSLDQFRLLTSPPSSLGISLVYFMKELIESCLEVSTIFRVLSRCFPSVMFIKVDAGANSDVAVATNVRIVPAIKLYKNGVLKRETTKPTLELLESWLLHYTKT